MLGLRHFREWVSFFIFIIMRFMTVRFKHGMGTIFCKLRVSKASFLLLM